MPPQEQTRRLSDRGGAQPSETKKQEVKEETKQEEGLPDIEKIQLAAARTSNVQLAPGAFGANNVI